MFLYLLFRERNADADLPTGLVLWHDMRLSRLWIFAVAHFNMRKSMKYFPFISIQIGCFLLLYFSPLVGTEELGHLEMVGTLVHQLTRNLTEDQIRTAGFDAYFVDHTTGVYPQFASGYPWSASTMQVTGDVIADLTEDLAADGAMVKRQHGSPLVCAGMAGKALAEMADAWGRTLRDYFAREELAVMNAVAVALAV